MKLILDIDVQERYADRYVARITEAIAGVENSICGASIKVKRYKKPKPKIVEVEKIVEKIVEVEKKTPARKRVAKKKVARKKASRGKKIAKS